MTEFRPADDDLLSAYLDGELSAAEAGEVARAVAGNPAAAARLEEYRDLSALLKGLPAEPAPVGTRAAILRHVEQHALLAGLDLTGQPTPAPPQPAGGTQAVPDTEAIRSAKPGRRRNRAARTLAGLSSVAVAVCAAYLAGRYGSRPAVDRPGVTMATNEAAAPRAAAPSEMARGEMARGEMAEVAETRDLRTYDSYRNPNVAALNALDLNRNMRYSDPENAPAAASGEVAESVAADQLADRAVPLSGATADSVGGLGGTLGTAPDVTAGMAMAGGRGGEPAGPTADGYAFGTANSLRKDGLYGLRDGSPAAGGNDLRVGEVITYLEQNEENVVVVQATVIDVRQAIDALQIVMARNAIPLAAQNGFGLGWPENFAAGAGFGGGGGFDGVRPQIGQLKQGRRPPDDGLAVYVEATPQQLVTTLAELKSSNLFVDLAPAGTLTPPESTAVAALNSSQTDLLASLSQQLQRRSQDARLHLSPGEPAFAKKAGDAGDRQAETPPRGMHLLDDRDAGGTPLPTQADAESAAKPRGVASGGAEPPATAPEPEIAALRMAGPAVSRSAVPSPPAARPTDPRGASKQEGFPPAADAPASAGDEASQNAAASQMKEQIAGQEPDRAADRSRTGSPAQSGYQTIIRVPESLSPPRLAARGTRLRQQIASQEFTADEKSRANYYTQGRARGASAERVRVMLVLAGEPPLPPAPVEAPRP